MSDSLRVSFFGSSLVSAYWDEAATHYRGLIRALHEHGHRVTFCEPDAYQDQQHSDIADQDWARVVGYSGTDEPATLDCVRQARGSDVVINCSGVGVSDALLEKAVLETHAHDSVVAFLDVDASATLDRMEAAAEAAFRKLVPEYDLILTFGGGDTVVEAYTRNGVRQCLPLFLEPDKEVLVVERETAEHLDSLIPERAQGIGLAARPRIPASHTLAHRAEQLEGILRVSTEEVIP